MKAIVFPILALTVGLGVVHASGPIAVYALVDKVAFEHNADQPERIRITGVFSTAQQRSDVYSEPQRGYLYLALPATNTDIARREWNDLKSVAGSRQVIGLGSNWMSQVHVRVRKADEDPKSPDEYPMGNGVVKINADHPKAKALLEYKDR
jgi:hypothetical protein